MTVTPLASHAASSSEDDKPLVLAVDDDRMMLTVLVKRLEQQRLPKALDLKEKVDRGETLNEFDIQFLEEVFRDAQHARGLIERHPEWQELAIKLIGLYKEITDKALENEKADKPNS